jgi:acyl-coenzyme A thioesterase PaaI-like protein
MTNPPSTTALLDLWKKLQGLPGGKLIFSWMLGRRVPYTGTIGPRIHSLEPGHAVVRFRDRRRVRNHLRSVHAVALTNLGELATGLALSSALPAEMRGIPTRLSTRFERKARGTITAECRFDEPLGGGEQDCEVEAVLSDPAGEVVARTTATWRVGPRA